MITTSAPSAGGSGPNFDLPPIASALPSVSSQTAVPFSQLLLNTPPPAPPPPTPQPPANDKNASTNDNAQGDGQSANTSSQAEPNAQTPEDETPAPTADGSVAAAPSSQTDATAPYAVRAETSHGYAPGKPAPAQVARSDNRANHASTANSATNPSAVALAAVSAPSKPSSASTTGPLEDSKPATHDASHSTDAAQTDATAQATAAAALAVSAPNTPIVDAPATDKSGGKGKSATGGKGVANAAVSPSSRFAPSSPAGTGPSTSQPPVDASGATAGAAGAADARTSEHAAAANQAKAAVQDAATLAAAQTGPDHLTATSSSTPATDATTTGEATAAVSQAVQTVAPSTPQTATSTNVALSSVTNSTPAQPAAVAGEPGGSNAPPPAAVQAGTATFANVSSQDATNAPASAGLSTADRARFVQRVARAFQSVGDQGGEIRLRLSPPELGSLQLQITVKQGALTANIQADNSTAQQVLLGSLPDLRDRLAQQGIQIERFDVQVGGQSSGGLPQSPQGNPDFDQAGRQWATTRTVASLTAETTSGDLPQTAAVLANGALNVIV